jgi:hypothetical protein
MPNLQIASPFDSTVYSSVWSIGIVTYSLLYPLSPNEPVEDACSQGCRYQTLSFGGSSGTSTIRLCTSSRDGHRSCLIRHRQVAFPCISQLPEKTPLVLYCIISYLTHNCPRVLHLASVEIICTTYEDEYERVRVG